MVEPADSQSGSQTDCFLTRQSEVAVESPVTLARERLLLFSFCVCLPVLSPAKFRKSSGTSPQLESPWIEWIVSVQLLTREQPSQETATIAVGEEAMRARVETDNAAMGRYAPAVAAP